MDRLRVFRTVAFLLFVGAVVFGVKPQALRATTYFPSCESWDFYGTSNFVLYNCAVDGGEACYTQELETECEQACAAEFSADGDMYICYSGYPPPSYPDPNGYCVCWV